MIWVVIGLLLLLVLANGTLREFLAILVMWAILWLLSAGIVALIVYALLQEVP